MKILIIGQGYAGSLLSCLLVRKGIDVLVADNPITYAATKVSAGILNPITGKRLLISYRADEFIPVAVEMYDTIFAETSVPIFTSKPVMHVFNSPANRNDWFARSAEPAYLEYCGEITESANVHPSVHAPFGAISLNKSGWVNASGLQSAIRDWLIKRNSYVETVVEPGELVPGKDSVIWRNNHYDYVVFCEGFTGNGPQYFTHIPFSPAKGEIIDFTAEGLQEDFITIGSVYIVPLGQGKFRAGATHEWNNLDPHPTLAGMEELTTALKNLIKAPFQITAHQAGIRPAVTDRRPVIGVHPEISRFVVLNGLGTKASLLAPACAHMVCNLLLDKLPPDPAMDAARFVSKYKGLRFS